MIFSLNSTKSQKWQQVKLNSYIPDAFLSFMRASAAYKRAAITRIQNAQCFCVVAFSLHVIHNVHQEFRD